jgi:hypothetical protein
MDRTAQRHGCFAHGRDVERLASFVPAIVVAAGVARRPLPGRARRGVPRHHPAFVACAQATGAILDDDPRSTPRNPAYWK